MTIKFVFLNAMQLLVNFIIVFLWAIVLWALKSHSNTIFFVMSLLAIWLLQDHNYGQPPPMTPPDSNSPGPEDGDTGNEDDEDDGVTRCIW